MIYGRGQAVSTAETVVPKETGDQAMSLKIRILRTYRSPNPILPPGFPEPVRAHLPPCTQRPYGNQTVPEDGST